MFTLSLQTFDFPYDAPRCWITHRKPVVIDGNLKDFQEKIDNLNQEFVNKAIKSVEKAIKGTHFKIGKIIKALNGLDRENDALSKTIANFEGQKECLLNRIKEAETTLESLKSGVFTFGANVQIRYKYVASKFEANDFTKTVKDFSKNLSYEDL